MSTDSISLICGLIIPIIVAAITKSKANTGVKVAVNALLSAIAAYLATVVPGTPWSWSSMAVSVSVAFTASTLSYAGLWKNIGVTDAVTRATPDFGIG